jgi:predicted Na+-dependent transporter
LHGILFFSQRSFLNHFDFGHSSINIATEKGFYIICPSMYPWYKMQPDLLIKDSVLIVFSISTMFSIGLSVNLKQIKAIISNYKLVTKGVLASILIIPLVAWILVQIIPLNESISIGIVLVSVCAGGAPGPKLAQLSRSDTPFTATMMVHSFNLDCIYRPHVALYSSQFFYSYYQY